MLKVVVLSRRRRRHSPRQRVPIVYMNGMSFFWYIGYIDLWFGTGILQSNEGRCLPGEDNVGIGLAIRR